MERGELDDKAENDKKQRFIILCNFCGFSWIYRPRITPHMWVTCPSCKRNVKRITTENHNADDDIRA